MGMQSSRIAIAIVVLVPIMSAQTQPLTADQVLENHIRATGGRERYEAVQTMYEKLELSGDLNESLIWSNMPVRVNQNAVTESYFAAPNRRVSITTYLGGRAAGASGCDGKRAWYSEPGVGFNEATKGSVYDRLCAPLFEFPLHWRDRVKKAEVRATKKVSGREMLVVRLFRTDDDYGDYCFDPQSYFLLRVEAFHRFAGRQMKLTTSYSDFSTVGGLIFPFSISQEADLNVSNLKLRQSQRQ